MSTTNLPAPSSSRPRSEPRPEWRLLGQSRTHREMMETLEGYLRDPVPVLVLVGETGTGKSLVARELHRMGSRSEAPFLGVPCGAYPVRMLEEEIFGPAHDGFPGAARMARGGTLHLDDADRIPPTVRNLVRRLARGEVKRGSHFSGPEAPLLLLSSRQTTPEGPHDVPWADLPTLHLPALRHRESDVELLAEAFLREWAGTRAAPVPEIAADARRALHEHPWPGNVRELRITMERAAEVAPGAQIREEHLRIRTRDTRPLQGSAAPATEMIRIPPEGLTLEAIEAEAVRATLRIAGGNRSQAARILGISRPTMARKIRLYGAEDEGLR